jgi:hypothetical protein
MERRMDKRHLFGMAAALLIAGAAPTAAVDNATGDATQCICWCSLRGGGIVADLIYNAPASGCGALQGKTCNVEDPYEPVIIRQGWLNGCEPHVEMEQSAVPGDQDGWVADPGEGGQGRWGGQVGPLLNGTFEQQ